MPTGNILSNSKTSDILSLVCNEQTLWGLFLLLLLQPYLVLWEIIGIIDHYPETAVLVGVINQDQTEEMAAEYLEELAFLAETAGAEPTCCFYTATGGSPSQNLYWFR